jgi:mRNA-degrading endonuclease RelE of RelBE toxin-antitoxin system
MYVLKFGKRFDKEFWKIDKSISIQIFKKIEKLKENPRNFGKPLLYTKPQLWEFKAESFRVFYLIQDNLKEVWLLSVKSKDECENYIRKGYIKDTE